NLGTVLDTLELKECLECYKEALALNPADYRSNQTIASYYLKNISEKACDEHIEEIETIILPHIEFLILKCPSTASGYNLASWAYTLLAHGYLMTDDIEKFKTYRTQAKKYLQLSELFHENKSIYDANLNRFNRLG
ncbi:MAG: hypothetical protein K2F83_08265, partial [Oscillospiraceae bacterium]|nr:hypothetical protein [Oscillospiraceae bacterium]